MKHRGKRLVDIADDVGMYFLTAACAFLSSYLPAFRTGENFEIHLGAGRILMACILALLVTAVFELRGILHVGSLEEVTRVKASKRKNLWIRIIVSIALGFASTTVLDLVTRILGIQP